MTLNNGSTLQLRSDVNTTFASAGGGNFGTATIDVDQTISGGGNGVKTLTLGGSFWMNGNAVLSVATSSGDTLALGTANINSGGSDTETISAAAGSRNPCGRPS